MIYDCSGLNNGECIHGFISIVGCTQRQTSSGDWFGGTPMCCQEEHVVKIWPDGKPKGRIDADTPRK